MFSSDPVLLPTLKGAHATASLSIHATALLSVRPRLATLRGNFREWHFLTSDPHELESNETNRRKMQKRLDRTVWCQKGVATATPKRHDHKEGRKHEEMSGRRRMVSGGEVKYVRTVYALMRREVPASQYPPTTNSPT
jgi:hypothetical protein